MAAYPVAGPKDIIGNNSKLGCLDNDLKVAIEKALKNSDREVCQKHGKKYTWEKYRDTFLKNIAIN